MRRISDEHETDEEQGMRVMSRQTYLANAALKIARLDEMLKLPLARGSEG